MEILVSVFMRRWYAAARALRDRVFQDTHAAKWQTEAD
jgi:hypothetical protein